MSNVEDRVNKDDDTPLRNVLRSFGATPAQAVEAERQIGKLFNDIYQHGLRDGHGEHSECAAQTRHRDLKDMIGDLYNLTREELRRLAVEALLISDGPDSPHEINQQNGGTAIQVEYYPARTADQGAFWVEIKELQ